MARHAVVGIAVLFGFTQRVRDGRARDKVLGNGEWQHPDADGDEVGQFRSHQGDRISNGLENMLHDPDPNVIAN